MTHSAAPVNENTPCPQCRLADQTYKVSLIFLESSTRLQHADALNQPELDRLLVDMLPDPANTAEQDHLLRRFVQVFAPPPGGVRPPRRVHPDVAFSVFLMLLIVMLYQLAVAQPGYLPIALGLLTGGVLLYLFGRASVLRRFKEQARQEQDAVHRAEGAVKRWAQVYFCSRDRGIFHPDENQIIPLERLREYLYEP